MTNITLPRKWNRTVRYALAPIIVALTLVCRLALNPVLHNDSPFMYFFVAIIVTGWLGGLGPGLLATVLSALTINFFYLPPVEAFLPESAREVILTISFLVLAVVISLIINLMRREQQRAVQAAGEARMNEIRYRATYEHADIGIERLDEHGRLLEVNPALSRMLGYTGEELIGRTFVEITHPDDRAGESRLLEQLKRREILSYKLEKRYLRKDGQPVWGRLTSSLAPEGAGFYRISVVEDISERKQAEERLREAERLKESARRLADIINFLPDATFALDNAGRIIAWNRAMEDLTGAPAAEVLGKGNHEYTWRLYGQRIPCLADELLRGDKAQWSYSDLIREEDLIKAETFIPRLKPGGAWLSIRVAPIYDAQGNAVGVIDSCRDITERKRTEDLVLADLQAMTRLRQTGARSVQPDVGFDAMLGEFVETAIFILEADMGNLQLFDATSGALRIKAHRGFEEPFLQFFDTVHDEPAACGAAMRLGERVAVEDVTQSPIFAGTPALAVLLEAGVGAVQSTPLVSSAGRLLGMISTHFGRPHPFPERDLRLMDLLARQAADYIERKRMEDSLKEADRRKDEFMAMLAHELRNPLAPIRYAVQMLNMNGLAPEQIQKQHGVIDRQVSHMGRLLDDLLEVSRITRGKIQLKREVVDLRAIATHALDSLRPMIEGREQHLSYEAPDAPLPVDGDPTRLEQIIRNLLHNANKYTEAGGCITLSLELEAGHETEWRAVVRVRDSGIGIAPEMLPRVFEAFVQAEQGLARSQGGLGIGLAMVRNLAQMHGGSVEARSEGPGKGSEFIVRLPLAAQARGGLKELAAPEEPHKAALARPRRVLVVEDNEDAAATLGELLSLWGHEIQTAHDGRHALTAARQWQPEIVLLDIGLPGMDGYEVARRLREDPATSRAVIVALTGYGQEEDRRRALEAGFNRHLTKPVELERLQELFHAA